MAESFTNFDDVVDFVRDYIESFDDFPQSYDCISIAKHVSWWDEYSQKFMIIKNDRDFWGEVAAHALA